MSLRTRFATILALALSCILPAQSQEQEPAQAQARTQAQPPERPSDWVDKAPVRSRRFMVATANPLATEAGYEDPARWRQCRGCGGRGAARAGAGRAAVVRTGRRRLAALRRCQIAAPDRLRRPRNRTCRGETRSLSRCGRQAAGVLRRRDRRTIGRCAGHDAAARGRAAQVRPPALEAAVRAGDRHRPAWLRGLAAAARAARGRDALVAASRARLFPGRRWSAAPGRRAAEESGVRAHAGHARRARRQRAVLRTDRRRHRTHCGSRACASRRPRPA